MSVKVDKVDIKAIVSGTNDKAYCCNLKRSRRSPRVPSGRSFCDGSRSYNSTLLEAAKQKTSGLMGGLNFFFK